MNAKRVPSYDKLMNPLLKAIHALGGSGTIAEINDKVFEIEAFPEDILSVPHGENTGQSEVEYRLAWARTYLKKYGLLENSGRGVWSLVQGKSEVAGIDPATVVKYVGDQYREARKLADESKAEETPFHDTADEPEEFKDWRSRLKDVVVALDPSAFERLAQRVLRESGFIQVEVTGKTGDGGIDGKGIMRVGGLLSFHVMFQCKKYQGSVTASQVRDFRGALQGRADKGLLITTGSFTRDAVKEATRDGAPPIDLVDGDQLAEKLKELGLGVKTSTVEKVDVNETWFKTI
jgi:restriction system protein